MSTFRLSVRVNPNTSRQKAVWKGDFLKVNLTSPPEDGKANEELVEFLGELFDIDSGLITLERGSTSSEKELLLEGIDRESLVRRISQLKG